MQRKKPFYTELAYLLGIVILALGTAFMERADYGLSMVVAPAYLLHLKVSEFLPFFSFGMAEYCFQLVILALLTLVMRRFRPYYLFSFVTAVFYGFVLDGEMLLVAFLPCQGTVLRLIFYAVGLVLCSLGVALLFHTYIAPEAYELFVKELSAKTGIAISKCKTAYDCVSCLLGIALSFLFFGFGHFEGVKLGTILCALINGWIIGRITKWLEARFEFRDRLKLRRFFEAEAKKEES